MARDSIPGAVRPQPGDRQRVEGDGASMRALCGAGRPKRVRVDGIVGAACGTLQRGCSRHPGRARLQMKRDAALQVEGVAGVGAGRGMSFPATWGNRRRQVMAPRCAAGGVTVNSKQIDDGIADLESSSRLRRELWTRQRELEFR